VIAIQSLWMGHTPVLGPDPEHVVLLVPSLFIATLSLATGRTTILQGGIHLVIFGAFLIISAMP
jgi:Ca2+:H+ antiporter